MHSNVWNNEISNTGGDGVHISSSTIINSVTVQHWVREAERAVQNIDPGTPGRGDLIDLMEDAPQTFNADKPRHLDWWVKTSDAINKIVSASASTAKAVAPAGAALWALIQN